MAPAEGASPFYAYRDAALGGTQAASCAAEEGGAYCFDTAPCMGGVPALVEPSAPSASSAVSSMDQDHDNGDQGSSLDALLAAAARKPGAAIPTQHGPMTFVTPPLPPAARAVLGCYGAARIPSGTPAGITAAAADLVAAWGLADTWYCYDLGEVARLHAAWCAAMPRVSPFYAVKCNPEPGVVAMLDALGAGFDCASIQELERAAALGVPQSRVIFANPCKRPADFRYAAEKGVEYTTFDCASELEKIAAGFPGFKCVLRIRCDDETCKINLGLKYGADPSEDVPALLRLARDLGLQVVGVSFHVGSGCQNVAVYADAIRRAREAFDAAAALGFNNMHLLDIGGGFTAPYDPASASLFYRTAAVINGALDECFPPGCGVRIIAEPGRYFAETSATLFTTILGQRSAMLADGTPFRDYWLSDGTYGSFRIQVAVDGLEPTYSVLRSPLLPPPAPELEAPTPCRLWGDSERDQDCVHRNAHLPALRDGDWLSFPYAGAYTICSASNFGGVRMTEPTKLFVWSEAAVRDLGPVYNDPAAHAAASKPARRLASIEADAAAALVAAEMLQALSVGCRSGEDDAMSDDTCAALQSA